MKKIYISFLVAVGMFVSGCNFLDIEPKTEWSQDELPVEDRQLEGLLGGGYERLNNALLQGFITYGDERADVYYIYDRAQTAHSYINRNQLDGNLSRASWQSFYEVIRQANVVLANVDKFLDNPENGTTARYKYLYVKGQAYTMRAYAYFWIARIWGEAPIFNEVANDSSKDYSRSKSSSKDIFVQIHSDLDAALEQFSQITNTGINVYTTMKGARHRFGPVAARAIKAQSYMWQASSEDDANYYQSALSILTDSKSPISSDYSLGSLYAPEQLVNVPATLAADTKTSKLRAYIATTGFSKTFNSATGATGTESIYELAFSAADGNINNTFDTFWTSTSSPSTLKAREELYFELYKDIYSNEEGRPGGTDLTDFRLYATLAAPSISTDATRINAGKWVVNYTRGDSRNIVLVRLADLLLLRAEARIRPLTADPVAASDVASILTDINLVRVRAMGPDAAIQTSAVASWTKDDWNNLIKGERKRELLFEGQRWFDLMRWKDAFSTLANMTPATRATYPYETGAIVYNNPNPNALYWPVSNEEIRIGGSMILQNPYYR